MAAATAELASAQPDILDRLSRMAGGVVNVAPSSADLVWKAPIVDHQHSPVGHPTPGSFQTRTCSGAGTAPARQGGARYRAE